MALRTKIKNLFIPRKTQDPAKQPGYGTDMRAIEQWALEVLNYLNNNGIIEIVAGSGVTVTNPFGPVTTISASGGGGGITDLTSPDGSITITNPTGPITNVDVEGWPFPPFADGLFNVGYGPTVLFNITTGNHNTAVGNSALNAATSGSANTAYGGGALDHLTTGSDNVAVGNTSGDGLTTGQFNTFVGLSSGTNVTAGQENTAIGAQSGPTSNLSNTTCLGYTTTAAVAGGVAIGIDHTGGAAASQNQDDFVLGTHNHIMVLTNHTTGSTTCTLGTNSPSVSTTPTGWIRIRGINGIGSNIGYIPYFE